MFKGTKATTAAHCGHCHDAIVADKTHAGTFYTVTELGDAGKIHTEVNSESFNICFASAFA
jgi:hypothetical protein